MLSPKTFYLYQKYLPDFSSTHFYPLSIYALNTKKEIIKFLSFFILFFVSLNVIEKKSQFERLFLAIIIWGAVLAFYGCIRKYLILGKEITGSFSTFGNTNSFAAYMVMVAPLALGYALSCKNNFKKIIFGFIAAVICASIFLSFSKAGSLALLFSLTLMVIMTNREGVIKRKHWLIYTTVILGIILTLFAGYSPIKKEFLSLWQDYLGRWNLAKNAFRIIKDFPLFGVGLGNFQHIFTLYRKIIYHKYFIYLHNDHLQLIVETGLIASFFYFAFLFTTFKDILIKLNTRRDPFAKYLVTGGVCGLLGLLLHSFFDYNFHIPAISMLFWLVLGLIYKCVYTHFYK